ncbi:NitT/TauT family transport system permease protein [Leucobacter luti]|uniref:NitT/TauT family transport system permease protein n=1 Tax=Leucobacter luti TaxID=340320 RepID=A0A4V6PVL2_9MICO|nr:ABC transporter permease [Leucobacter luti]TDP89738.1 NitT/TauT family transport system permease protein [Leucobacter luti]
MSNTEILSVAQATGKIRKPRKNGPQWLSILLVVIGILAVWQLAVVIGGVPTIILPSPLDVVQEVFEVLANLFTGGYLLGELWLTIQEIMIGFALALVVGSLIGLWVGETRFAQRAILPIFVLLEASPKIAFAPVFIAWFGFGITSKFVLAAFMSVFPIIVNTAGGLAATSADELKLFKSMRATPLQVFIKLKLFRALPFVFAGLKVAMMSAVTGAVAAEFITGGTGFGEQIRIAATRLAIDRVFAMIFVLSLLGLALFGILTLLERRFVFWGEGKRRSKSRS